MKQAQGILVIILSFLFVPLANASQGAVNGGGGKGIYCTDSSDGSLSLNVLDIYEARQKQGWQSMHEFANFDSQKLELSKKLAIIFNINEPFADRWIQETLHAFKFSRSGQRIDSIDDAGLVNLKPGCRMVQIAHFHGRPMGELTGSLPQGPAYWVDVDLDYWNALTPLNQIALVVHEMIYEQQQEQGAVDSVGTRLVTQFILSNSNVEPVASGLPDRSSLFCHSLVGPATYFYVYQTTINGQPVSVAQFTFILGIPVFTKTTAVFTNVKIDVFQNREDQSHSQTFQTSSPLYGNQFVGDEVSLSSTVSSDGTAELTAHSTVQGAPGAQSRWISCTAE